MSVHWSIINSIIEKQRVAFDFNNTLYEIAAPVLSLYVVRYVLLDYVIMAFDVMKSRLSWIESVHYT